MVGNTYLTVSRCTFVRNFAIEKGVVTVVAQTLNRQAGNITIANSVLSNQETGELWVLFIYSNFRTKLINTVLTSYFCALYIRGSLPNASYYAYPFFLSINNCSFLDNTRDIVASSPDPTHAEVKIKNTNFTSMQAIPDSFGLLLVIFPLRKINFSEAIIELENVNFDSKPCNLVGLLFSENKTLRAKSSSFLNGICVDKYFWTGITTA